MSDRALAILTLLIVLSVAAMFSARAMPVESRDDLTYAFTVIELRNGHFLPDHVFVYKNATVVWVNRDEHEHAIVSQAFVSPPICPGESYTVNIHEFGVFNCSCRYHPGELCRVIVK
jgi:plastocyanin